MAEAIIESNKNLNPVEEPDKYELAGLENTLLNLKQRQKRTYTFSLGLARRVNALEVKMARTAPGKTSGTGIPEMDDIELNATFAKLVRWWKKETVNVSSVEQMVLHDAYLQIIGLGPRAIPLILAELERELDYWFLALRSLARTEPIYKDKSDNLIAVRKAWLEWGRKHVSY